ncbi:hypothetical protein Adt_11492 [Abeliophyllum distichum]|uniref:Uncharacterized protein n=1 Tax=Abeliophyllum distichum TaxID=126358 RepID=A0ABD1UN03_9LAMI
MQQAFGTYLSIRPHHQLGICLRIRPFPLGTYLCIKLYLYLEICLRIRPIPLGTCLCIRPHLQLEIHLCNRPLSTWDTSLHQALSPIRDPPMQQLHIKSHPI